MALARFPTAGDVINAAAVELGLARAADPFADPNLTQFPQLLSSAGDALARAHEWRHLIREHTFTTEEGVYSYALPADFLALVPRSTWARTSGYPLVPLSVVDWQTRQVTPFTGPFTGEVRVDGNLLRLVSGTPAGEQLAMEYRSRAWVRPAAAGLGDGNTLGPDGSDVVEATGDVVLFDKPLAIAALKLAWKRERGMDTGTAEQDFQTALRRALELTTTRPVLDLRGGTGTSRLDPPRVPESF